MGGCKHLYTSRTYERVKYLYVTFVASRNEQPFSLFLRKEKRVYTTKNIYLHSFTQIGAVLSSAVEHLIAVQTVLRSIRRGRSSFLETHL